MYSLALGLRFITAEAVLYTYFAVHFDPGPSKQNVVKGFLCVFGLESTVAGCEGSANRPTPNTHTILPVSTMSIDLATRKKALDAVLESQAWVQHITPFNEFLETHIPLMIKNNGNINTVYEEDGTRYEICISTQNYRYARQQITPHEAHMRNMNYMLDLLVDLKLEVYELPANPAEVDQPVRLVNIAGDMELPKIRRPWKKRTQQDMMDEIAREDAMRQRDQELKKLIHESLEEDVILTSLPAMLHSKACILSDGCGMESSMQVEMGGSFIMRGKRRMIPYMERLHYNEPFFFVEKEGYVCQVRSQHLDRPYRSTSSIKVVLTYPRKGKHHINKGNQIFLDIPFLKSPIPIHVLVMAFGWTFEQFQESMLQMDSHAEELVPLISTCMERMRETRGGCTNQHEAIMYIVECYKRYNANTEKLKRSVMHTLHSEILPHLNDILPDDHATRIYKLRYISMLCAQLFRLSNGLIQPTNRDSYKHIVVNGAADLLAELFRQTLIGFIGTATKTLRRALKPPKVKKKKNAQMPGNSDKVEIKPVYERFSITKLYNSDRFTPRIATALSMGKWSDNRKGISHSMKTTNGFLILAQMRRISSSYLSNQGKHVDPRMAKPACYGFTCVAETPEGKACGLVYTLAMTTIVSSQGETDTISMFMTEHVLKDLFVPLHTTAPSAQVPKTKLIGPNGILLGWVHQPEEARRRIVDLRRHHQLDPHLSVVWNKDYNFLTLRASSGRLMRPLLVMENVHKLPQLLLHHKGHNLLTVLMQHGVIEYLDPAEEYSGPHAVYVSKGPHHGVCSYHTHMELTDIAFMGLSAACIPFFRHNQAPRVVYQLGMQKQYISAEAEDDHGARKTHIMYHGQVPGVRTANDIINPDYCDGINCVVALMAHDFAQEDAVVFHKAFTERGAFMTATKKTHTCTHTPRNVNQEQDRFERPDPQTTAYMKMGDYSKIGPHGLPTPGTQMKKRDILIGKTIPATNTTSSRSKMPMPQMRKDASVQIRQDDEGTVSDVMIAPGIRKVGVRCMRPTEQGDKFTNRHGQKGTAGYMCPTEDMPFCMQDGMIPDIIVGPTSFPSRMTVGMLLEMMLGKAVMMTGSKELGIDSQLMTAQITEETINRVSTILKKHGAHHTGTVTMVSGITGEVLEADIFMGVLFYGKMDHMVANKIHARQRGPVDPITLQPVEGRGNNGGFRLGGMEIDSLVASGVSAILQERTTKVSDERRLYICAQCGFRADGNPDVGMYMCRFCSTSAYVRTVTQSHSAHIMFAELEADGIKVQFKLEDQDNMIKGVKSPMKRQRLL